MEQYDQFIESLLQENNVTVDGDVREELKRDMLDRLTTQMNVALVNQLPEDKLDEYSAKLDDPNFTAEESMKFMEDNGVDTKRTLLETMFQFRFLYTANGNLTHEQAYEAAKEAADLALQGKNEAASEVVMNMKKKSLGKESVKADLIDALENEPRKVRRSGPGTYRDYDSNLGFSPENFKAQSDEGVSKENVGSDGDSVIFEDLEGQNDSGNNAENA